MLEKRDRDNPTGTEIAVIGMAGRFPGARHIDEFWTNLKNGIEAICFFSDQELLEAGIPRGVLKNPYYVKARGVLADINSFDSDFFRYSAREAEAMDPQLRLLHETCWQALEDAGYTPFSFQGLIGLYAGAVNSNDRLSQFKTLAGQLTEVERYEIDILNSSGYFCNRISYELDLRGPSIFVQTACSTSLAAIHLACQGLLAGECEMALAGGVRVAFPVKSGYFYQEGMLSSSSGHIWSFEARADGTVFGDGAGIVVLKSLEDAIAHGDNIYALIKGSAINNDGSRKVGFTAPGINGQAAVIQAALLAANVEPESITYVEAHGTGTTLGDSIEIQALTQAFAPGKKRFCALGSVKPNVGNLETAGGVAGFIKAVLALKHRCIPPGINFETPNPRIDFTVSPFYIPPHPLKWERGQEPLRAGVNSSGLGGTNAHVVLEEWPGPSSRARNGEPGAEEPRLILLSARTGTALGQMTRNLVDHFKANPGINLADAAYTLQVGREAFNHRRMVLVKTIEEVIARLADPDPENVYTSVLHKDNGTLVSMTGPAEAKADNPGDLEKLGTAWLQGDKIDWQTFYGKTKEKRSRVPLPTYPFENRLPETSTLTLSPAPPRHPTAENKYPPEAAARSAINTREEIAAIWKDVLNREEIGFDDNFFTLGGDSIKALHIVTRLYKAGYKTDLKTFFQYPTISQLASRVEDARGGLAEQGEVIGILPSTPFQEEFFCQSGSISEYARHSNPAVMLPWPGGIPLEAASLIFKKLQRHHDGLRISFPGVDGENNRVIRIEPSQSYPFSLQVFDLRRKEKPQALLETLSQEIQSSIHLDTGPLMKLALLQLDNGDRLLMVIHPLAADRDSWHILLEDIETLIRQYQAEQPLELPLKTDSVKTWAQELREYAQREKLLEEKAYWQSLTSQVIPCLKRDYPETNQGKHTHSLFSCLSEEETRQLSTDALHAFGTRIEELLLVALGLAVHKTFKIDRLLVTLAGNGREEILEKVRVSRTVGNFTFTFPVILDISPDRDLARQIKDVKETLRKIKNRGIGYGILKYLVPGEYRGGLDFHPQPQVFFGYHEAFDPGPENPAIPVCREISGSARNPVRNREYAIELQGILRHRQLEISLQFKARQYKTETMELLLQHFKSQLLLLISYCVSRPERELTPGDLTYKRLSIEAVEALSKTYPLKDLYPLSPMQEGILFHTVYDRHSPVYLVQIPFKLYGAVDETLVEKSLNQLIRRHDILRTVFNYQGLDRPLQIVLKEGKLDFHYEDLRQLGEAGAKAAFVKEFLARNLKNIFSLTAGPAMRFALLRLHDSECLLNWSFHHILIDGWCISVLGAEFYEIYESYLEKRPYRLAEAPPYARYIQWLQNRDMDSSALYWKKYLEDYESPAALPGRMPDNPSRQFDYRKILADFTAAQSLALNRLSRKYNATVNTVMQTIWGIILAKYSGKTDVVFGSIVSGRPPEIKEVNMIVGLFINIIPVRIRFRENTKFHELVEQVRQNAAESNPHHYYPMIKIQEWHPLKQGLLETVYSFQNFQELKEAESFNNAEDNPGDKKPKKHRFEMEELISHEQTNNPFTFILCPGQGLSFRIEYNGSRYETSLVERLVRHIAEVVDQVTKNETLTLRDIKIDYQLLEAKSNIYKQDLSTFEF